MGRAKRGIQAVADTPRFGFAQMLEERALAKGKAREAVSKAIGVKAVAASESGDGYDAWYPDEESEITLCLQYDEGKLSVTRISCWPEGAGWGRKVVQSLRDHAQSQGLALEVPDPFTSSIPFWESFDWHDVGHGDRIVYRLDAQSQSPSSS